MEFSFSANRWLTPEELKDPENKKDFALGLHVPRFFDRIIDVAHCWIQTEQMNAVLKFSKHYFKQAGIAPYHLRSHDGVLRHLVLRQSFAEQQVMVNVVTATGLEAVLPDYAEALVRECPFVSSVYNTINRGVAQVATGEEQNLIYGAEVLVEKLGKFRFEISPDSFFQTNSRQAERLYEVVKQYAEVQGRLVWDLLRHRQHRHLRGGDGPKDHRVRDRGECGARCLPQCRAERHYQLRICRRRSALQSHEIC